MANPICAPVARRNHLVARAEDYLQEIASRIESRLVRMAEKLAVPSPKD